MRPPFFRWLATLKEGFLQLLYPNICWACGHFVDETTKGICPACQLLLLRDAAPTCPRCASSVGPYVNVENGCGNCHKEHYAFERTFRLGPYEGLLREVILRLKNSRAETLAEILGQLWAEQMAPRLRSLAPQAVVPVPLHWTRRYWERGFNQSEVLARCLARSLQIPCYPSCVRRLRRTPRQTLQETPAARRTNVHGAFQARSHYPLAGKTVLLVNDVMTTGATANEVARALGAFKPGRIVLVVLAHGK